MPYAIRNASLELLSPCSLSIACKSFYVFWDIFESFRLQKIVLEITWMGIKTILLKQMLTILWYDSQPSTYRFEILPLFKVLPFIFPLLWSASPSCSSNCSRASWRQLRKEDFPTQNPSLLWKRERM